MTICQNIDFLEPLPKIQKLIMWEVYNNKTYNLVELDALEQINTFK